MTLIDKACYERGCANYDYRDKSDTVKIGSVDEIRNATLEEVAKEFDAMKYFGDTAMSFAAYVRGMKR
jgi:hypothetical protein